MFIRRRSKRYQLLPPLRPEEFAALEADIRQRGILVPVEVDQDGCILDGHHRAEIAAKLLIRCPTVVRRFATEREKREHTIKMNLARRQLDPIRWGRAFAIFLAGRGVRSGQGSRNDLATSPTVGEVAAELGVASSTAFHRLKLGRAYESLPENMRAEVDAGSLTVPQARRVIERRRSLKELQRGVSRANGSFAGGTAWEVRCSDCLQGLSRIPPRSVRLAFADPPYNQGVDYGQGEAADRRPAAEYLAWCRQWMAAVVRTLAPDGSLWVLIADEYADQFGSLLKDVGLHRRQWLIWYETFGANRVRGFNRCSRHLFWMVKDEKRFVFHEQAVLRASDRAVKYQDPRAQPGGKVWDSVWGVNPAIPRLVENSRERLPGFPTQLPLALVVPVIACASDPHDLVLDPFSGSGTTGEAAVRLGRRFLGLERNERYARLSRRRMQAATTRLPSAHL